MFKVYGANGVYDFKPFAITPKGTFLMGEDDYEYYKVTVVEHDESGKLTFREVNTLSRVEDDDDGEWMKMTGYYDQPIATNGTWAVMDVFRALDISKAEYRYMLRWDAGDEIISYLVKDHIDLAELVDKFKVLGEVLHKPQ